MSRRLLLFVPCLAVLLAGCGGYGTYNGPFINTDETLRLREGMTTEQTRDIVGVPLMVIAGDKDTRQVIWIYEVRGQAVKSYQSGQPVKRSETWGHTGPLHRLQVVFVDGVVHHWGPFDGQLPEPFVESADDTVDVAVADWTTGVAMPSSSGPKYPPGERVTLVYQQQAVSDPMTVQGLRAEKDLTRKLGVGVQGGIQRYPEHEYSYYDEYYYRYYEYYGGGATEFWYGGYIYADAVAAGPAHLIPAAGVTHWGNSTGLFMEARLRVAVTARLALEAGGGYVADTVDGGYYLAGGTMRF